MLATLLSLAAFAAIALTSFALGNAALRRLKLDDEDSISRITWSVAIGLVAAGMALTALGLFGGLNATLICWMTVAGACWGLWAVSRSNCQSDRKRHSATDGLAIRLTLALAVLAALGSLIGALAPATAGDALCYHLELPKFFLAEGRLAFSPYHDNATFPLLAEMWYLWAMALDGPVAANLVHWGLGLLFALAAVLLAQPMLGRRWAILAGCAVLLTPGVTNQMTAALNDVALAAFTTLALAAWQRGAADAGRLRWFVIAGLMAGAALAIKYVAILFAAAAGAVFFAMVIRKSGTALRAVGPLRRGAPCHNSPGQESFRGVILTLFIAALVSVTWYARAAWYRGNPVYPFFSHVFVSDAPPPRQKDKTPLELTAGDLAATAWRITMQPERFGGRGHQLGAFFLAVLPGLFAVRWRRGLGTLLAIAAIYAGLWYALRQNVRFLYPIVPLLAIAGVWTWREMRRWPAAPRRLARCACFALLLFSAAIPVARARRFLPVAAGWQTREEYLLAQEPAYRAARFAARQLPPDASILSQDYRALYFPCQVVRENTFRRRTAYPALCRRPADFSRYLRRAGFTHLLLAESQGPGIRYNRTLNHLVSAARQSAPRSISPLMDYTVRDADQTTRRYRLFELR